MTHVTDLLPFCYGKEFMLYVSLENQSNITETFNSTYLCLDYLLDIVIYWW